MAAGMAAAGMATMATMAAMMEAPPPRLDAACRSGDGAELQERMEALEQRSAPAGGACSVRAGEAAPARGAPAHGRPCFGAPGVASCGGGGEGDSGSPFSAYDERSLLVEQLTPPSYGVVGGGGVWGGSEPAQPERHVSPPIPARPSEVAASESPGGPSAPAPMDPAAVMRAGSYVYDDDDDDAGINYYPA